MRQRRHNAPGWNRDKANRIHISGHGLDVERDLIERPQSLATGDIRPCRDNRQSKKGWRKEPRKAMSLRAAQRKRSKRNEIIFCAGVAVDGGADD